MLYLFAGAPRDGDIRWQLEQLCKQRRVSLDMKEFDFVRDPLQDLASPELWDAILIFAGAVRGSDGMQPRPTTRQFPLAVQKICQFIRAADSGHPFASFVILRNVHSALHQDHNNSAAPNILIPITSFEGGGVWIQDTTGQDFRWHQGSLVAGHPHSFADGPIYLPARDRLHETLPWSGDRAIVAAYTPAGLDTLSAADVQFLESLGFCWQPATPPLEGGARAPQPA